MFERFTEDARRVVVQAQREARGLGHNWIGTEHLLLGVLAARDSSLTDTLGTLGLTHDAVRSGLLTTVGAGVDDGDALRELGIDLDDVRRRVEERFGPGAMEQVAHPGRRRRWWSRSRRRDGCRRVSGAGHIPLTPKAKKALELSLREAVAMRSQEIRANHLVLGILRGDCLAVTLVQRLGITLDDVRRAVRDLGKAA